jgi:DUF1680 family protein
MELALYNALLTGMSHNGKAFTYTNQLASSDTDPSKREEWFDCACCPPNIARFLGYFGGYIHHSKQTVDKAIEIDVLLYTQSTTNFALDGGGKVDLQQETGYPSNGLVRFKLDKPAGVHVTIKLRIPAWAEGWTVRLFNQTTIHTNNQAYISQLTPSPSSTALTAGFLALPPDYTNTNITFTLHLPMSPRLLMPHPYTNQRTITIARGPLVYCAEDVDNNWVDDHFKSVCFERDAKLEEYERDDVLDGETIVGIRAIQAGTVVHMEEDFNPVLGVQQRNEEGRREQKTIEFIPYYARANRGGKGMMRVGFRMM